MSKVWNNKARRCFVQEEELSPEFKRIIYPDLMRLNYEFNNIICMVKEYYSGFSNNDGLVKRIKATDELIASKMALEMHSLLKKKIRDATSLKDDLRKEMEALVMSKAKWIDDDLKKYARQTRTLDETTIESYSETQKLVQKKVIDYNTTAEARRLLTLKQDLELLFTQPVPSTTNSATQDQNEQKSGARDRSSSGSSSSDENRQVITWTSEPIESLPTQSNLSGTEGQANTDMTDRIDDSVFIQPEQPPVDYARIIENTKFEQAEQLQLEGFPANNYIYCIEPATGDPNSFDVGTYGMII